MARFLWKYLLVTGIFAALALAWPPLVVLGQLLLYVPGFILANAPTAFAYGLVFTAGWLVSRVFLDPRAAALAGTTFVAAVMFGVPALVKAEVDSVVAKARQHDRKPEQPVALSGILTIDREAGWEGRRSRGGRDPNAIDCDALCTVALFTPGITAVVLTERASRDGHAVAAVTTFRLRARAQGEPACSDATPRIDDYPFTSGLFIDRSTVEAMVLAMKFALAGNLCLSREPGNPPPDPDWTLRFEHGGERVYGVSACRFAPRMAYRGLILSDRNQVVLRQTGVVSAHLASPLSIVFKGGLKGPVPEFECHEHRSHDGGYDAFVLLNQTTRLAFTAEEAALKVPKLADLRAVVAAALYDPATPADAAAFDLIGPLLRGMTADGGPAKLDRDAFVLLNHLINDRRIRVAAFRYQAMEILAARSR